MLNGELIDEAMLRALTLARRSPVNDVNPQVGCVILAPEGRIVAEGWHRGAGTPHAEVDALTHLSPSCREQAATLTAVVTLEPCNHHGKTGPCATALIEAGIGAVAYALDDPSTVAGGGAATLRTAGVEVRGGVRRSEARAILAPWLERHEEASASTPEGAAAAAPTPLTRRPHVTIKWAQTLDGRAAAADGTSQWITGPEARADVHRRRAAADAILVGIGTIVADDPSLTARDSDGGWLVPAAQQPRPVVIGHRAIPDQARVNAHPAGTPLRFSGDDLASHLAELRDLGVTEVFVEGGPAIASSLLRAGLVDELLIYLAPALLGGPRLALDDLGIDSMNGIVRLDLRSVDRLGDDLLVVAAPHRGDPGVDPGVDPRLESRFDSRQEDH